MANLYWVTIRINKDNGYDKRYKGFLEALSKAKDKGYWAEPTSFWMVESRLEIDAFLGALSGPLNASTDMVLTRKIAHDEARYFGAVERPDVLKSFIPSVKKLP